MITGLGTLGSWEDVITGLDLDLGLELDHAVCVGVFHLSRQQHSRMKYAAPRGLLVLVCECSVCRGVGC